MPAENLHNNTEGMDSPADNAVAVVPHATDELATVTRAIYVGGAGNLVVSMWGGGADVTFSGLAAGTVLPIRAKAVRATSTATNIVALY